MTPALWGRSSLVRKANFVPKGYSQQLVIIACPLFLLRLHTEDVQIPTRWTSDPSTTETMPRRFLAESASVGRSSQLRTAGVLVASVVSAPELDLKKAETGVERSSFLWDGCGSAFLSTRNLSGSWLLRSCRG